MKFKRLFLIPAFIIFLTTITHSATLVVDNTPFPFFCGGFIPCINCEGFSWGSTYQTIQEAVNNADDGDTIKICKGDYNEQVLISDIKRLTITNGADVSSPEDVNLFFNGDVLIIGDNNHKVEKLKIKNISITSISSSSASKVIRINYAKNKIELNHLVIESEGADGVYVDSNTNNNLKLYIRNSIIATSNNGNSLKVFKSKKVYINGCRFSSNGEKTIYIEDDVKELKLRNSCIYNLSNSPSSYGIYIHNNSSRNKIKINYNCIYAPNGGNYAFDIKSHKWDKNYWDGVTDVNGDGKISGEDTDKISEHIIDNHPKTSCPFNCEEVGNQPFTLVAEYRMDECDWNGSTEEVIDSSSNGYNGTAHNVTTTNGKLCNSGDFSQNSNNDYVELPSEVLNGLDDFSISVWIKTSFSGSQTILSGSNNYEDNELWMWFPNSTTFKPHVKGNTHGRMQHIRNIADNQWHHIVWTRHEDENCLYIDGALERCKNLGHSAEGSLNITYPVSIGEDRDDSGGFNSNDDFQGLIDELKIFAKTLTPDEVQEIYNNEMNNINWNGTDRECPSCRFEPVADFHFDECSWSGVNGEIIDSSGNGYNGTAKNGIVNQNVLSNPPLCKKGVFNGTNQYIEVPNLSNILKGTASLSFWIKTTQTGNNIDWLAPGVIGVEEYEGEDDIFWGWIDAHGHIGISKGDNFHNSKSHTPINDGQWHHIVLTRNANNGHVKIYIDGNLDKSGTTDSGIVGTPFSSIGRIENTNTSIPPEYFQGELDEIKVFDFILNDSQVQQIYNNEKNGKNFDGTVRECPACPKVNHYEIIHDSNALTCEPENITIKACENDNCSTLYSNNVTITLSPSGWIGGDTKSFSGGEATFKLKHTTAETVTLGILSSDPSADFCCRNPDIDSDCVNDEEHCNIVFNDAGFVFDVPNQLSCKNSDNIIIRAVEKNDETNECKPSFTNTTKNLKFWFNYQTPSDNINGVKLKLKGNQNSNFNELPTSEPSSSNVEIHFNSNGIGTFQVKYNDAGRLNLHAKYEDSSGLIMTGDDVFGGSGNGFVVKPYRFLIDIPDNPEATSANGDIFKKAGEDFEMKIIAVCSDNSTVTKNYFSGSDGVEINHTLILPSSGNSGNLRVTGAVINNGEKTINNQSFSEVGIISINVIDSDYLGAGSISGSVDYVGRFTPHHFIIENISNGVLNEKCSENFNYSGQKTDYSNIPQFTIVAKNKDNQTTENYKDNFYKLSLSSFNIQIPQYDDNQLGADGINKVKILIENSPDSLISNNDGTAKYSFENDNITYIREDNSKIAPFSPQFSFKINSVEDSDGISCINLPQTVKVTGKTIKYGRLKIFDNYGPETENLKIPVKTEYWNGDRWIKNIDDSCTQLNSSYFELYNFTGNLNPGETSITDVKSISAGEGSLTLTAPGENNDGSVSIKLNNIYDYLIDEKTPGKATFGIFRGRDRIIFWQEVAPDE